jgi:hypothetical protein
MIDTGFTGFLMMPLTEAFELALTLYGTSNWTLADGSSQPKLLGYGTVVIEDIYTHGVIVLEPNTSRPLLGVEFLKKSKRALVVGSRGCGLVDEQWFIDIAAELREKSNPTPSEPTPGTQD